MKEKREEEEGDRERRDQRAAATRAEGRARAGTNLVESGALELLQALANGLQRLALVQELAPRVA